MNLAGKCMLVLDSATPVAQAGLLRDGEWLQWRSSRGDAERALFEVTEECLQAAPISISDVEALVFCEGPGSMLGVRIATMAIRGWQAVLADPKPVFSYYSLHAAALLLSRQGQTPPFSVVSDARRGFWNVFRAGQPGPPGRIERLEAERLAELPAPVFRIEEARKTPCPVEVRHAAYDFGGGPEIFLDPALLRPNDAAEAYLPTPPDFKKWTAERHR